MCVCVYDKPKSSLQPGGIDSKESEGENADQDVSTYGEASGGQGLIVDNVWQSEAQNKNHVNNMRNSRMYKRYMCTTSHMQQSTSKSGKASCDITRNVSNTYAPQENYSF